MPETCDVHESMRHDISEVVKSAALIAASVGRMQVENERFQKLILDRVEKTEKAMSHWRWWTGGVASCVSVGVVAVGVAARMGWLN